MGFIAFPPAPRDQFFGKSPCLGEMLLFTVYSCLQAQIMELTGPPYVCQIPCFARDFRKGPKRHLRGKTSCFGRNAIIYSIFVPADLEHATSGSAIYVSNPMFCQRSSQRPKKTVCAGKRPVRKPNGPRFALKMPFAVQKNANKTEKKKRQKDK